MGKTKMRARKVGRSCENACVSYSHLGDSEYELIRDSDGVTIGTVRKINRGRSFQAVVADKSGTFRTMEDVRAWASNLIYDGEI